METRKSHEEGIESSIYNLLFYNQSNMTNIQSVIENLDITDSCENIFQEKRKFESTDDSMHVVNQQKVDGLKESTKKLLHLLERISCDTQTEQMDNMIPIRVSKPIQRHEDDEKCSIYNRLTRKCQCLNNSTYNDFILQFNENIKHSTCDLGEIIKNMRIVKRFLYMGDGYTRNALLFLREGLTQSSISEKADILQGCIHADICNIFEDHSVVTTFIIWPCKYGTSGDYMIQMLTGILLYKIASTEEGKRYLNFNSKIAYDIKHALQKQGAKLNKETVETLNTTLHLLEQHLARHSNVICCSKCKNKGIETQTLMNLFKSHKQMTISEVALNLEILNSYCKQGHGKLELGEKLPHLLLLLKNILRNCDSSEINIAATNILSNVISKSIKYDKRHGKNIKITVMSTATEPIQMRNELIQMNGKKIKRKKCKVQDFSWDSIVMEKTKKACDKTRKQTIIVPVD